MTQNGNLTTKQHRAVAAMLVEKTVEDAAAKAGVGARTVYRWMAGDPAFVSALRRAEDRLVDDAVRQLVQYATEAIETTATIMRSKRTPSYVRVRAAGLILDTLVKIRELRNVESRLANLEDAIRELGISATG